MEKSLRRIVVCAGRWDHVARQGRIFFSSGCRRYIGVDGGLEKVSRDNVGDVVTNVLMHVKGREGVSGCRRDHHVVGEDMINVTLRS